jgi:hypothetical protein
MVVAMMGLTRVVITIAMMTPMRANTDDREDDICWDEMMGMIGMIGMIEKWLWW